MKVFSMKLGKYNKAIAAVLAGVVVAIPVAIQALSDNQVTATEWLEILGSFLPAVGVLLSPANRLDNGQLVNEINKNPDINLKPVTAVVDK